MTLNSKIFRGRGSLPAILAYVESLVDALADDGLELEVAVRPGPDRRPRRADLKNAMPADAEDWERSEYLFRFSRGEYFWKGVPVHISAGEALFLYRWLAQGDFAATESHYLRNIRKRCGNGFLAEIKKVGARAGEADSAARGKTRANLNRAAMPDRSVSVESVESAASAEFMASVASAKRDEAGGEALVIRRPLLGPAIAAPQRSGVCAGRCC